MFGGTDRSRRVGQISARFRFVLRSRRALARAVLKRTRDLMSAAVQVESCQAQVVLPRMPGSEPFGKDASISQAVDVVKVTHRQSTWIDLLAQSGVATGFGRYST